MLKEIYCEKFSKKQIIFHNGLNSILGTQFGDNSIGKSTMLMIIDYVFGGNDYIEKSPDVQSNVGFHEFKIHFVFDKDYYFIRNNKNTLVVYICDENYSIEKEIDIDSYKNFLAEKYHINDISFRDCVSTYSRIYGRDNLNEHKPLHVSQRVGDEEQIIKLIRLFGNYNLIKWYKDIVSEAKDTWNIFNKAQKLNFISNITAKERSEKIKELEVISKELQDISNKYDQAFTNIDLSLSTAALDIKNKLAYAKRQKAKLQAKILGLHRSLNEENSIITKKFEGLREFFPNVNLEKINKIENFHNSINIILKQEQTDEINNLTNLLNTLDIEINNYEIELKSLISTTNISTAILKNYAYLQKQKDIIEQQLMLFDKKVEIINNKKQAENNYESILENQERKIEADINQNLLRLNNKIYDEVIKPPVLNLQRTQYTYYTPDDTGTGTNYKNLVLFDLSILQLTQLPYIIEDSVLLKQIADKPLENILKVFKESDKQIFISLDKQTSYSSITLDILNKSCVLKLHPNGGELFGRSWNK